jgi:hypothetical protein
MAMTPVLWSLNALAVEFGLDRRTVAARLRDTPPGGKTKGGHDGWRLVDVVEALTGYGGRAGSSPAAAGDVKDFSMIGAPFSVAGGPIDEALCAAVFVMVNQVPWHAAMLAAYSGSGLPAAHALYRSMCTDMALLCDDLIEGWGIVWRNKNHYEIPPEPNWAKLAAQLGERVDRAAWRRHEAAMGKRFHAIVKGAK